MSTMDSATSTGYQEPKCHSDQRDQDTCKLRQADEHLQQKQQLLLLEKTDESPSDGTKDSTLDGSQPIIKADSKVSSAVKAGASGPGDATSPDRKSSNAVSSSNSSAVTIATCAATSSESDGNNDSDDSDSTASSISRSLKFKEFSDTDSLRGMLDGNGAWLNNPNEQAALDTEDIFFDMNPRWRRAYMQEMHRADKCGGMVLLCPDEDCTPAEKLVRTPPSTRKSSQWLSFASNLPAGETSPLSISPSSSSSASLLSASFCMSLTPSPQIQKFIRAIPSPQQSKNFNESVPVYFWHRSKAFDEGAASTPTSFKRPQCVDVGADADAEAEAKASMDEGSCAMSSPGSTTSPLSQASAILVGEVPASKAWHVPMLPSMSSAWSKSKTSREGTEMLIPKITTTTLTPPHKTKMLGLVEESSPESIFQHLSVPSKFGRQVDHDSMDMSMHGGGVSKLTDKHSTRRRSNNSRTTAATTAASAVTADKPKSSSIWSLQSLRQSLTSRRLQRDWADSASADEVTTLTPVTDSSMSESSVSDFEDMDSTNERQEDDGSLFNLSTEPNEASTGVPVHWRQRLDSVEMDLFVRLSV